MFAVTATFTLLCQIEQEPFASALVLDAKSLQVVANGFQ